jgi:hypothetical protein
MRVEGVSRIKIGFFFQVSVPSFDNIHFIYYFGSF